jgi:hypothetical protein
MARRPIIRPAKQFPVILDWDGATLGRFMMSKAKLVYLQGPYGSGKSYVCCMKLLANALAQPLNPTTMRRRRVTYIVRETLDQLQRTTLPTWQKVLKPEIFGAPQGQRPMVQHITWGDLDWHVWFLALDGATDREKLESSEPSDAWANEGRHFRWETIKVLHDRIGRFPPYTEEGCFNPQLLIDSNAAPEDHPLTVLSGQAPMPDGLSEEDRTRYVAPLPVDGKEQWEFFVQPPAAIEKFDAEGRVTGYELNPARENQKFLDPDYYPRLLLGATKAEIRERVLNKPGVYRKGRPVWPQFRAEVHVAPAPLEAIPGHPIIVGVDFGRTPAAICGQQVFGQWRVLRELVAEGTGARAFARMLKASLAEWFPEMTFAIYGDPSGENLEQSDDISPFLMFRAEGLKILPAPTNDPAVRIGAVDEAMRSMIEGRPGFYVSPACRVLIAACAGGYEFRRLQVAGMERYSDQPDKNRYSHPADGCQYMVLGGGGGAALLGRTGATGRPRVVPTVVSRERGWGKFGRRR